MQSRPYEGDLRERVTRTEMGLQFLTSRSEEQARTMNRIGTKVIDYERDMSTLKDRQNHTDKSVTLLLSDRQEVLSIKKSGLMIISGGKYAAAVILLWLAADGHMSQASIKAIKIGLGLAG